MQEISTWTAQVPTAESVQYANRNGPLAQTVKSGVLRRANIFKTCERAEEEEKDED